MTVAWWAISRSVAAEKGKTMDNAQLTVTINAKLDVDRKTAETCLRLVEAYLNDNSNVVIEHKQCENGEVELRFLEV